MSLEKMGQAAREAAYQLATVSTAQKNRAPVSYTHLTLPTNA